MTNNNRLVLYLVANDQISHQVLVALRQIEPAMRDVTIEIKYANLEKCRHRRLPALLYLVGTKVVKKLEGSITSDDILYALRSF